MSAASSLAVRLANLRALLEPDRPAGAPSTLLVRDGQGYRLAAQPDQIAAVRLERLVTEAATLSPQAALAAYDEALALWRGTPFGDVAYADFAQAEIRRLEELRARAAGAHHMVRFSLRALGVAASSAGDHAAAVLAERRHLQAAAVLLGATADWPAPPYLGAFAARARERVAELGPERLADATARGRLLDLEGAKALARAAI